MTVLNALADVATILSLFVVVGQAAWAVWRSRQDSKKR
jgi:hypothetical protein